MGKRMLVSLAHPDDELFGSGSLIAKYVAEGAEVTLICSTNGDVGTVDDKFMEGYKSIAELRLAELDCAAKVLGFKEVVLFGYRDSNMMGHADNQNPACLWAAPDAEVTQRVLDVMNRVKPQVVLTFDPYGGYGHPDHIKMNRATLAAFKLAKPAPQKLYYSAIPAMMVRVGLTIIRLQGKDPRKFGRNADMDMQAVADNILPTHARINTGPYLEIGRQAAACHASQSPFSASNPITKFVSRRLGSASRLTQVYPEPKPGEPIERDLFAGVKVD